MADQLSRTERFHALQAARRNAQRSANRAGSEVREAARERRRQEDLWYGKATERTNPDYEHISEQDRLDREAEYADRDWRAGQAPACVLDAEDEREAP